MVCHTALRINAEILVNNKISHSDRAYPINFRMRGFQLIGGVICRFAYNLYCPDTRQYGLAVVVELFFGKAFQKGNAIGSGFDDVL